MNGLEGTGGGGASPRSKRHALAVLLIVFIMVIATIAFMETREPREKFSQGLIIHPYYPDELSSYGGGPYPLSPPNVRCSGAVNVPPDSPLSEPYRNDREPAVSANAGHGAPRGESFAASPPDDEAGGPLVYAPPMHRALDAVEPSWWPASGFDDRWSPLEGEAARTIHTYRAGTTRPLLCGATPAEEWRYYGGPYGWTFSPYW